MDGKVNRTRMGRFIELKDQHGITQLVAPLDVSIQKNRSIMSSNEIIMNILFFAEHKRKQTIRKYAARVIHHRHWNG